MITLPLLTIVAGLAGAILLWRSVAVLRDTTLTGPWLWSILALIAVASCEALIARAGDMKSHAEADWLRYATGISTLCPVVALLGAKKPQHAAWQFVVATLYVILLVPAAQAWRPAGNLIIEAPWAWFILAIIGAGLICGAATRFWPATLAVTAAQLLLLGPFLSVLANLGGLNHVALSFRDGTGTLCAMLLLLAAIIFVRVRGLPPRRTGLPLDQLWLDFRDSFGMLWALRVQQRINASAVTYEWPLVLRWDGFCDSTGQKKIQRLPPELEISVEQAMRALLWRFVTAEWIDRRLARGQDS